VKGTAGLKMQQLASSLNITIGQNQSGNGVVVKKDRKKSTFTGRVGGVEEKITIQELK